MTSFSHYFLSILIYKHNNIFSLCFLNDYYINKIENLMAFLEEIYEAESVF